MSMKHAPGPWRPSDFGGGRTIICTSDDPLARFTRVAVVAHGNILWCEAGEANALLIAAAPDLLEACQKLLEAYGEAHALHDLGDCEGSILARAAITKATGERP